ncbi:hypothetical protein GCM10010469_18220 [Streptomyces labedae]|uniref:Uncharacterized protein n=1 Tax=Streptomyces labedae TaxID=285569 RepID=A0ABP6QT36_9ACTN
MPGVPGVPAVPAMGCATCPSSTAQLLSGPHGTSIPRPPSAHCQEGFLLDGEEGKPGAERASRARPGHGEGAAPGRSRAPPLPRFLRLPVGGSCGYLVVFGPGSGDAAIDCGETELA